MIKIISFFVCIIFLAAANAQTFSGNLYILSNQSIKIVLCPDKKLNYIDHYFFKDQSKKHSRTGGSERLFNAEIWKKNHISSSSLSGHSIS